MLRYTDQKDRLSSYNPETEGIKCVVCKQNINVDIPLETENIPPETEIPTNTRNNIPTINNPNSNNIPDEGCVSCTNKHKMHYKCYKSLIDNDNDSNYCPENGCNVILDSYNMYFCGKTSNGYVLGGKKGGKNKSSRRNRKKIGKIDL